MNIYKRLNELCCHKIYYIVEDNTFGQNGDTSMLKDA